MDFLESQLSGQSNSSRYTLLIVANTKKYIVELELEHLAGGGQNRARSSAAPISKRRVEMLYTQLPCNGVPATIYSNCRSN